MSVIVKRNRITIVFVNARSGDNMPPKVSADVFGDDGRITEVGFSIDINPVLLIAVNRGSDFLEGVTKAGMHYVKKCGLERYFAVCS